MKKKKGLDFKIIRAAVGLAFVKLDPRTQLRNPVMFLVFLGSLYVTVRLFFQFDWFAFQIAAWLWFTVLFANFAEAVAEGRGRAQADSLRKARKDTMARRMLGGKEVLTVASDLNHNDLVVCEAGDTIPADGDVVEGVAMVDESAITGESAPVLRESGGDRCAVTGGTRVLSDRIVIRITSEKGNTFLDRMIAMVEGASRKKTPNEVALTVVLASLSIILLLSVVTLYPLGIYSFKEAGQENSLTITQLIALLVCLIPTTIGALLSAIGISGIDRMIRANVIATSGRAVEAAGDIDVLMLDKTGTITLGNRMASDLVPAPGVEIYDLARAAQIASLADETPEGRSIVVLCKDRFGLREKPEGEFTFIPFKAETRVSGIELGNKRILKGAQDAIKKITEAAGNDFPEAVNRAVAEIAGKGGTPLVVSEDNRVLGTVHLKDVVKGGIKERFGELRRMGIKTIMITGDNPLTAAAIAAEAGVDDFMAQSTPEMKLARIRTEQGAGHMVAMTGDGTNDAPALAQADVGVAMNTGTQAAREAGNMVDLDSNPTKLIEIVEIGKQMLVTRGALTTFSIANDVAKFFAIIPAMFATLFASSKPLAILDVMRLSSPQNAILAAVIFNALIIVALIPLALRGVRTRGYSPQGLLKRNLLLYGLGGLVLPFAGIKAIDMLLVLLQGGGN
jgi:K+-transporting ATPase ATPase B chain